MTIENKEKGFIKVYRTMMSWEWWDDINTFRLFMTILISVNWQDKKWRGRKIPRGSMFTSINSLAKMSGLTVRQTRTTLNHLISTNEVTSKVTKDGRLISVVNYDFYQDYAEEPTNKSTNKRASKRQSTDKAPTTTKESKEYKEYKKGGRKRPVPSSADDYLQSVIDGKE